MDKRMQWELYLEHNPDVAKDIKDRDAQALEQAGRYPMDNRRLIDADKIMEWINYEIAKKFPDEEKQYADGRQSVMTLLKRRIEQGVFIPDPIPPTIKPGDKVRHIKHPEWGVGEVNRLHGAGISATVYFSNVPYVPRYHRLSDLEVISHD